MLLCILATQPGEMEKWSGVGLTNAAPLVLLGSNS
jgi:hypothetical protein